MNNPTHPRGLRRLGHSPYRIPTAPEPVLLHQFFTPVSDLSVLKHCIKVPVLTCTCFLTSILQTHHLTWQVSLYDSSELFYYLSPILLNIKIVSILNSGNEETERILSQTGHGGTRWHQGGGVLSQTALRSPKWWVAALGYCAIQRLIYQSFPHRALFLKA